MAKRKVNTRWLKRLKIPKEKNSKKYQDMWRLIDGVIRDTFSRHQDYLTVKGQGSARGSLVKRLAPVLNSFIAQAYGVSLAGRKRLPTKQEKKI